MKDNFDETQEILSENESENENEIKVTERFPDNSFTERDIFSTRKIEMNLPENHDIDTPKEKIHLEHEQKPFPVSQTKNSGDNMKTFLKTIIGVLSFLVLILVVCIVYFLNNKGAISSLQQAGLLPSTSQNSGLGEATIKYEPKPQDENQLSAETIYEKMAPSVVGVVVYDSEADVISGPISQGSGVIIDEKGYIVTNSHVVNNSKKNNIKIVLNTSEELSGKVVGYDTRTDLAVIKCDKEGLTSATLGDSDQVKVGESVLALGNPLGLNFASSLTRGIVSAVNRSKSLAGADSLVKYIQTDAAINPGNSGGPLINMYGQVIGINSMKIGAAGLEGMGFAIPSSDVKAVVADIISKGYVSGRVRLGIVAKMISNYQAQIYNVPVGILVSKIYRDSNLTSAGIQVGDIITKIGDVNITSFDVFYAELYKHKPGETISVSVFRTSAGSLNGNTFQANIILLEDRGETQEKEDDIQLR